MINIQYTDNVQETYVGNPTVPRKNKNILLLYMSCNNNINQLNNCNSKLTTCQTVSAGCLNNNNTTATQINNLTNENNSLTEQNNLLQQKLEELMLKCNLSGSNNSRYGLIPNNSYLQFKTVANTELFSNIETMDTNNMPLPTYLDINNQNNIINRSLTTLNDKYSTTTYNQSIQYIINEKNNLKWINKILLYIYFIIFIVIIFLFIFINKLENKQKIIYIIFFLIFPFVIYFIEYYIYFIFNYIYSIITGNVFTMNP